MRVPGCALSPASSVPPDELHRCRLPRRGAALRPGRQRDAGAGWLHHQRLRHHPPDVEPHLLWWASCPRPVPSPIPDPALCPAPAGLGAARPPRSQAGILGSEPAGWRFTAWGTMEPPSPPALAPCPVPWQGSLACPRAPRPPSPGVTGFLKIDENGDRESDYSLWDMDPVRGDFQVRASPSAGPPRSPGGYRGPHPTRVSSPSQIVANYNGTTKKIHMVPGREIHWPGNKVPSDVPPCGFDNSDPQCRKGERRGVSRGRPPSGQGPGCPRAPHRPPLTPQPA